MRATPRPVSHPVTLAVAATTAGVLPVFLVGALTVQITRQLHFAASGLGVVVAVFFVGATAGSLLAGKVAEWIGLSRAMRSATALSAVCLVAVGVLANSLLVLGVILCLAGFTDGVIQPAVNGFLAGRVASGRQGLAFGIKQSAIPLSTLLGGLAVPAIALTVGWRWAFLAAGALAAGIVVALPSARKMQRPPGVAPAADKGAVPAQGTPGTAGEGGSGVSQSGSTGSEAAGSARPIRSGAAGAGGSDLQLRALLVLAVGAGIGGGTANALGSFLISGTVAAHVAEGLAGVLAAAGSVCGLVVRILITSRADRQSTNQFRVVALMLALGAAGYALLAAEVPLLMVAGALLAFGAGWGWNGLFTYSVVRSHPHAPAKATGVTQAGVFVGAVAIPPLFGLLASQVSYTAAWAFDGALVSVGAVVMLAGARRIVLPRRAGSGSQRPAGGDAGVRPTPA